MNTGRMELLEASDGLDFVSVSPKRRKEVPQDNKGMAGRTDGRRKGIIRTVNCECTRDETELTGGGLPSGTKGRTDSVLRTPRTAAC